MVCINQGTRLDLNSHFVYFDFSC